MIDDNIVWQNLDNCDSSNFSGLGNMIDMAIFRFSRWHSSAILDFLKFKILKVSRVMRVNMRHHAQFRGIRSYGDFFVFFKMATF